MTIDNLIFDLDGTLIDSSEGVVEAVNYSLRRIGEPEQPPERIKAFIGYPLSQMYPTFTSAPVKELYRHFQEKASETVVSSTVVLPGVAEMLHFLHDQGYRLGIATTKIKNHVHGIIEKFQWHRLIAAYCGGDEVRRVKPDPEILLLALRRMGVGADNSMAVGDTINDVLAARAVPMTVTGVASLYGGRQKLLEARPDFFIESLPELPSVLNGLQKEAL
ncbi:MAG: HAD family hydrolase [Candidatus Zixiibacteriota bacterium]|nr:MAG: HAD family hydrolase [candidate division Zixibacteria bacterium]